MQGMCPAGVEMPDRYKREIEDILEKAGVPGDDSTASAKRPKKARRSRGVGRLAWLYVREALSGGVWSLSPGRVMLIGFVILLSTLLVMPFVGGVPGLLAWAGLIICIIGYGMFLARPPKTEKRWRGRPLQTTDERSRIRSAFDRIRRRLSQ